jgi:hypothetical protein
MCSEAELPPFLVTSIEAIRADCAPPPPKPELADEDAGDGGGATVNFVTAPLEAGPVNNEEASPD